MIVKCNGLTKLRRKSLQIVGRRAFAIVEEKSYGTVQQRNPRTLEEDITLSVGHRGRRLVEASCGRGAGERFVLRRFRFGGISISKVRVIISNGWRDRWQQVMSQCVV